MNELVVPRAVPVAPYTWGVAFDFAGNVQDSERVKVDINQPVEIVAMHAVVLATSSQSLLAPSADVILARFEVKHNLRVTKQVRQGDVMPAGLQIGYVPLSSLLHDVRLLGLEFRDPVADVALQFRWARDVAVTPIWEDARVFLSLLCRPIGRAQ